MSGERSLWVAVGRVAGMAARQWRVRYMRTLGAVLAIALGTGVVVWVTCCYESVRQTILDWAGDYVGKSHVNICSPLGKYDQLPQSLVERVAEVEGVAHVTARLVQRLHAELVPRAEVEGHEDEPQPFSMDKPQVDLHGIDLETEFVVRDHRATLVAGRMLTADDEFACVVESSFAADYGVGLGDYLRVWGGGRGGDDPYELKIVGLVKRRRIGRFQKGLALVRLPVLQEINVKQHLITSVDVVLTDATRRGIAKVAPHIRRAVLNVRRNARVTSADARMRQIQWAQDQQQFVLILLSCVAILTALFIILSTLSMGMIERISQLGLLRCVGMTGGQMALAVLFEVLPLGVFGIAAGIPIGLALTRLSVWLVPEYVGFFTISTTGMLVAICAGLATTLVAALLPMVAALRVTPLEAARPRARRPGRVLLFVVFGLALILLVAQLDIVGQRVQRTPQFRTWSAIAIITLYIVYALAAPLLIWLVGTPAVSAAAGLLRVRVRLLQSQIGHAVWRSAGICCGLMVGLSLIVGLVVFSESFQSGWQFPQQFPEAYVWSFDQMPGDASRLAEVIPGLGTYTAANAVNVIVEEKPLFMEKVFRSVTWFLGCNPDTFFDLVKLEFMEGDEQTARELLKSGGYVVIADDFARTRNKKLGDAVKVWFGSRMRTFTVAGVIQSPALDIAASYFQAESEMRVAATGSVLGTTADLERFFDVSGSKLILLNFDLPPEPMPPDWPPARYSVAGSRLSDNCFDEQVSVEKRWQRAREDLKLLEICQYMGAPQAFRGTARELKDAIDAELGKMTQLLAAVPAVALLVAAIGVANLMTANVASRARQLAILRAVGATRSLILRMVIGEALVLGLVGSGLGLALGMHLAADIVTMTERMWGVKVALEMPWGYVTAAVTLTVGLCVLAGILPARRASRTNVVDALHVP
ncbi:MAG: ABC transporter permease [Planctomycetes bacterium]|nr:ABC transporter permease [Planctomycetota bacterium]